MSSSIHAPRGLMAAFAVFVAAAMLLVGFAPGSASAADVTTGNANFNIASGKAGRVVAVQPARVAKRLGRGARVTAAVRNGRVAVNASARLAGGIRFVNGKRRVAVNGLTIALNSKRAVVRGRIGARTINVFNVAGRPTINRNARTVRLAGGRLSLTNVAAAQLRRVLRLNRAPRGRIGSFGINFRVTSNDPVDPCIANPNAEGCEPVDPCVANPDAEGCPIVDPYLAQCNVAATSKVPGTLPGAAPLPVLSGAKPIVGPAAFDWGFKQSFRSYIVFGASGSLQALDGATTVGGPPIISAFSFPAGAGQYAANDPLDMTDDQAVINGSGTALLCATGHEFRVAISNPTIVIDGENSRIVADIDTNLTNVWTPAQRVDLAKLHLDGITPFYNKSGSEVNWGEIEATFTDAGAKAICGTGEQTACSYVEGTELDPINVKVQTAYNPEPDPEAADPWLAFTETISTELPFPFSNPAQGGCMPNIPAGGSAAAARSIDEHNGYGGTSFNWEPDGGQPTAAPQLDEDADETLAGGLDWGVRSALRGSVNGTGEFNLFGGAVASHTPYVGNGTGSLPYPQPGGTGQMSGAGKYFTWPSDESDGVFDAGGPGTADDRLVLNGAGRVGFCNVLGAPPTIMSYGTVLSNPTVIVDGANSRITLDVATRFRHSWLRGRVDFASLDLSGVTPTSAPATGGVEITWPDIPATLTSDGSSVVRVLSSAYVAGAALDPVTVRATVPIEE